MPTLSELFPLEQLRAQACDPPVKKSRMDKLRERRNPEASPQAQPAFQPQPQQPQPVAQQPPQPQFRPPMPAQQPRPAMPPQKPAFGQPQQPQQRPGQQPPRPGMQESMGGDPGQLLDQIKLAVARLERIKQFASAGQDDNIGAAKTVLRLAHTAHVTGNYDAVPRHLNNASLVMNRIHTRTLGLPPPTTPSKLKKRDQTRDVRDQFRQAKTKQDIDTKLNPKPKPGFPAKKPAAKSAQPKKKVAGAKR